MAIEIKRNTGWWGMGSRIQIWINNEKVDKIMEKKTKDIMFSSETASLKVTMAGIKSKKIQVSSGDVVEIEASKWYSWSIPLLIVLNFLTIFIPSLTYRLIALVTASVLILVSMYVFNGFKLKVTKNKKIQEIK